jgi:hypothetical protein
LRAVLVLLAAFFLGAFRAVLFRAAFLRFDAFFLTGLPRLVLFPRRRACFAFRVIDLFGMSMSGASDGPP